MAINIIYCLATFLGALAKVDLIWNATDLINTGLLSINMYGILMLLPFIKLGLKEYEKHNKA